MELRFATLIVLVLASPTFAQPRGGEGRGQSNGPANAVLAAIDVNGDHEITLEEMKNAFASLKNLDKNGDGKLGREEIHPERIAGGERRGPNGPGFSGRPNEAPRQSGGRSREDIMERFRGFDKNKDGKVAKDELPARMQQMMARFDENKNDVLDQAELNNMVERLSAATPSRGPAEGPGSRAEGRDRRGGGGGPGGRGGPGGPGFGGGGPPSAEEVVSDAMSFDANKDGMLSKAELQKFAEQHARRGPPEGGPGFGRERGGHGGGPGPGGGGGERPQRPARPE